MSTAAQAWLHTPVARDPWAPCLELAPLIKAGDAVAFMEFRKLTQKQVIRTLSSCGIQDADDRFDLAANVYASFWRNRSTWRPERALAYLTDAAQRAARKSFWKVLTRTAPRREDDEADLSPVKPGTPVVRAEQPQIDWKATAVTLPPQLREVFTARLRGLSPEQISRNLGITLLEVWDRMFEAEAAALNAAGLPVVNQWLEAQFKRHGLLPADTLPFPCDLGWVVRHMPRVMRETVYAKLSCRGVDVPAVWGVKVPTFNKRLSNLKRVVWRYAVAAGVIPVPPHMQTVSIWLIADSIGLAAGSTFLYAAADWTGLPRKSDYSWPEARLIWEAAVSSDAYKTML